jgi:hypothetical protein
MDKIKEYKNIIISAVAVVGLFSSFIFFAPNLDERIEANKAYRKTKNPKQLNSKTEEFSSVLISWTEKDLVLIGSFYFVNNLKKDIKYFTLSCMSFDSNNQLLNIIEREVAILIPKQDNKKVIYLEIGKIDFETTQVSCKTVKY